MQTLDFVSGLHNCQDSPNPSSLDIMLCKHRKKVFYCFYKTTFPRKKKNSLFRLLIKNMHATIPKGNMGYDQYTVF